MLQAAAFALSLTAVMGLLATPIAAAPQAPEPARPAPLSRVKDAIEKTPPQSLKFDVKMTMPVATFRTTTQRDYMLPFVEQLRKEFELTPLQKQSAEWASKCCGLNLLSFTKGLKSAWRRRDERRTREQIARELADLRAAAKNQ
jgi:hypothetical protein